MHWMILPYRRYFEFSGRSRRKEYWWFAVFITVVLMVLVMAVIGTMFGLIQQFSQNPEALFRAIGSGSWTLLGLTMLFLLVSLIPMLTVQVRRLHDLGASGWWYLAYVVGGLALDEVPNIGTGLNSLLSLGWIVWMFFPGTKGPNKYGEDPKDPVNAEIFA